MTLFSPRTIDEFRTSLLTWLAENESRLTDASAGSVLTSLLRCFAVAQYDSEILLSQTAQRLFLETATDRFLDEWVSVFGLQRRPAKRASGFVLVRSLQNITAIDFYDCAFLEPTTQMVYEIISTTQLPDYNPLPGEQVFAVQAQEPGSLGNLPAGTPLIPTKPLDVEVVVGSHRNAAGQPCGSITGGRDLETDESLRERLFSKLLYKIPSKTTLRSVLLTNDEINNVRFFERLPGVIEVWVETDNPPTLEQLTNYEEQLEPYRPIGTKIVVNRAQYVDLFVRLEVLHIPTDRDELASGILRVVRRTVDSLDMHEPLRLEFIRNAVLSIPEIKMVNVVQPTSNVLPPVNHFLRLVDLKVTYDIL